VPQIDFAVAVAIDRFGQERDGDELSLTEGPAQEEIISKGDNCCCCIIFSAARSCGRAYPARGPAKLKLAKAAKRLYRPKTWPKSVSLPQIETRISFGTPNRASIPCNIAWFAAILALPIAIRGSTHRQVRPHRFHEFRLMEGVIENLWVQTNV